MSALMCHRGRDDAILRASASTIRATALYLAHLAGLQGAARRGAERVRSMIAAVNAITDSKGSGMFLFTDAKSLAAHGNPLTLPLVTTSGLVSIDTPPRFHPGPM